MNARADIRNMFLCTAIVAAAIVAVWPFADIAYGDDFAYAHLALQLAQTGHLVYNGWEFAMSLVHACWGALFIHIFGFSFECMRFSTIPLALGAVALCYQLVRRAGLRAKEAIFVTLLFGLCPLFLPLAVSYMTDVPCLFFLFASLYALTQAAEASLEGRGYGWLALGVVLGFLGGTGRQVVWLVLLAVLPYLAWVRRRQFRFAIASVSAWFLVILGVVEATSWANRQPYLAEQFSVLHELRAAIWQPGWEASITARLALMLFFLTLPAALPLVLRAWINTWRGAQFRRIFVGILLLAVLGAIFFHPSLASIPWVNGALNWEGISGTAPLLGRPIVLTRPIRALTALAVYVAGCILAGELVGMFQLARRAWNFLCNPPDRQFALGAMSIFGVVYFVLLVIRGAEVDLFDRYLIPMIPWVATGLLLWFEAENPEAEMMRRRAMPFAWAMLAVLAGYAILSTQDYWSLARARVAATKRLEAAGISRTAIDAGFEYNGWTQLLATGQMNDRWVKNPPGAYRPEFGITPNVVPVYRLEYQPTAESAPSEFGSVPYSSLLPPFHKHVSIDRVVIQTPLN
jgi:4-amino-4-deoxy-L-arabinose transferase-like glycosyltransferase